MYSVWCTQHCRWGCGSGVGLCLSADLGQGVDFWVLTWVCWVSWAVWGVVTLFKNQVCLVSEWNFTVHLNSLSHCAVRSLAEWRIATAPITSVGNQSFVTRVVEMYHSGLRGQPRSLTLQPVCLPVFGCHGSQGVLALVCDRVVTQRFFRALGLWKGKGLWLWPILRSGPLRQCSFINI